MMPGTLLGAKQFAVFQLLCLVCPLLSHPRKLTSRYEHSDLCSSFFPTSPPPPHTPIILSSLPCLFFTVAFITILHVTYLLIYCLSLLLSIRSKRLAALFYSVLLATHRIVLGTCQILSRYLFVE